MSIRTSLRRPRTWLIAIPVLIVLAVVGGPFVYINFVKEDPPARLSFEDSPSTSASDSTSTTTEAATETSTDDETGTSVAGAWTVGDGSIAGYRVGEVLFGQDTEAVGRTEEVTGELTIDGTTVDEASFVVDLTTVTSDEERRDNQFQGRIMDTATYPTATFVLTESIELGSIPADGEAVTTTATGDLTLRGVTNSVTFELSARLVDGTIEVTGAIPVTFADYGIPDASFGPTSVQDNGEVEFLLVLTSPVSPS